MALACGACSILLSSALIGQTTLYVDASTTGPGNGSAGSPFPAIGDAIDAASDGDSVLVLPGTYVETVVLHNKSVAIASSAGADATIIDGGGGGTVLDIAGYLAPTVSDVAGFTLTNGNGLISSIYGDPGGLAVSFATVTLTDCRITGNVAGIGAAGGIEATESDLVMVRCEVTDNIGGDTPATKNGLQGRGGTGGLRFRGVGPSSMVLLTMLDCLVGGNSGGDGSSWIFWPGVGGAGGIDVLNAGVAGSPATLTNCRVVGNVGGDGDSSGRGGSGGIALGNAGANFLHCTIAENVGGAVVGGAGTAGGGGVQLVFPAASAEIGNSILWGNRDAAGTASQIELLGGTATVVHSDVEGGYAGAGNIDSNPEFRDAVNGDYRLTAPSPCIDAGDATLSGLPLLDFEGDPRLAAGSVDIGADEGCLLGTDEGFELESLVNGLGIGRSCHKLASPGDVVALSIPAPASAFHGSVGIGFLQFYAAGTPGPITPLGLPTVHIDPSGPQTIYYSVSPIASSGTSLVAAIPGAFSGAAIRAQYFALSAAASNGLFAATGAHDIEIQ